MTTKKKPRRNKPQIHCRLNDRDVMRLMAFSKKSGHTNSRVVRMCVLHALPRIIESENILELQAASVMNQKNSKFYPIPTAFDPLDLRRLEEYSVKSGIPTSRLLRMCVLFALPSMMSGEVDMADLQRDSVLEK